MLYFTPERYSVPWLDGAGNNAATAAILWPEFTATWPLIKTPDGTETTAMGWYGLPLINTILLLTSSVTAHFAHVALEQEKAWFIEVLVRFNGCFRYRIFCIAKA